MKKKVREMKLKGSKKRYRPQSLISNGIRIVSNTELLLDNKIELLSSNHNKKNFTYLIFENKIFHIG